MREAKRDTIFGVLPCIVLRKEPNKGSRFFYLVSRSNCHSDAVQRYKELDPHGHGETNEPFKEGG